MYLSFDIDAIDPGFCPGTGTPEIGGLTSIQVNIHNCLATTNKRILNFLRCNQRDVNQ